jgi:hypothetical protein
MILLGYGYNFLFIDNEHLLTFNSYARVYLSTCGHGHPDIYCFVIRYTKIGDGFRA